MQTVLGDSSFMKSELDCSLVDLIFLLLRRLRLMEVFRIVKEGQDRKAGGGGLMIYVRSDIHFVKVKHLKGITPEEWAAFRTETIILKVKLGRSWIAVVGVYRPPSIPKHQ